MHAQNNLSKRYLPPAFGNSVIYHFIPNVLEQMHRVTSAKSKTFVVVVRLLEYIRKRQVVKTKKPNCGMYCRHNRVGESIELDREIFKSKCDIVYGSAEQWFSDTLTKVIAVAQLLQNEFVNSVESIFLGGISTLVAF